MCIRDRRVGRIELGDTFTFVEIDTKFVPLFMESFRDKTLNDRPIRVDIAEGQSSDRPRRSSYGGGRDGDRGGYGGGRSRSGERSDRGGSGGGYQKSYGRSFDRPSYRSERRTDSSRSATRTDPETVSYTVLDGYKRQV